MQAAGCRVALESERNSTSWYVAPTEMSPIDERSVDRSESWPTDASEILQLEVRRRAARAATVPTPARRLFRKSVELRAQSA